jgi:8-oxo-dGTP pyrophosphatase MutT (NUDIX family)
MERPAILAAIRARLEQALTMPTESLVRFSVGGQTAGWVTRSRIDRLAQFPRLFVIDADGLRFAPAFNDVATRTDAMAEVADALASAGQLTAWRDERYAVRPEFDAPPWFYLERACARWFGVQTWAVHVNGIVHDEGAPQLWFARRSPQKSIDPDCFDTLVGGGIAECDQAAETMEREAWEEAGIRAALAHTAILASRVQVKHYAPDGLQREVILVYDLALGRDFVPDNQDGEAVEHRRLSLDDAAALIAATGRRDMTTLDACMVTLDFLLRQRDWAIGFEARDELSMLCRRSVD